MKHIQYSNKQLEDHEKVVVYHFQKTNRKNNGLLVRHKAGDLL